METGSPAAGGPASRWATVPDTAVQEAFSETSRDAADTLSALRLVPGQHILREDVPEVLARAAGRALSGADAAAVLRCFALDAGAAIAASEFWASWRALQQLGATTAATHAGRGAVSRNPGAARQPALATQPVTAAAEVGWLHAAAPLPVRQRCEEVGGRYVPLRTTDVTKGGEGRSSSNQFGMYL